MRTCYLFVLAVLATLGLVLLFHADVNAAGPVYLTPPQPAPFAGYLFDTDTTRVLKNLDINLTACKAEWENDQKVISLQNDAIAKSTTQSTELQTQYLDVAHELNSTKRQSFWSNFAYFGLGIVATGFTVYEVNHLKH